MKRSQSWWKQKQDCIWFAAFAKFLFVLFSFSQTVQDQNKKKLTIFLCIIEATQYLQTLSTHLKWWIRSICTANNTKVNNAMLWVQEPLSEWNSWCTRRPWLHINLSQGLYVCVIDLITVIVYYCCNQTDGNVAASSRNYPWKYCVYSV